jgi:ATP synthase subunit 6
MQNFIIFSPLEQFEILPLLAFNFGVLDFSITNQTVILALILFFFSVLFFSCLKQSTSSLFIVPHRWQTIIEFIYSIVLSMVNENIGGNRNQLFFPLIFTIFFFVVSMNLIGLIPYSFTVTSHFIVTLALSLSIFLGMNIICVKVHGLEFFSLFLPSGTSFALAFLLVPVELISYIFKPLSLAIRLFCNMMAGHTLLKVFAG